MTLKLTDGTVITPFRTIEQGVVVIEGHQIAYVGTKNSNVPKGQKIEINGCYVSPGFIDIHVHGGGGHDVMEGTLDALDTIAQTHAKGGTTAWLATTVTAPIDEIAHALHAINQGMIAGLESAKLLGAHVEGPYLHPDQAGAQNPVHLRLPDPREYFLLLDRFPCTRRVSVAPELPGALELGNELRKRGILASIGHSNASYAEVLKAIEAGFSHVTHIYSGMSSVHRVSAYRIPGVLEATLVLDELTTEMIADGHHLPPSLMRLVLKAKGTNQVCVVTDAIAAAGLGPGQYQIGGLDVIVEDVVPDEYEVKLGPGSYVAKLVDRSAFAGSAATMIMLVRNLVNLVGLPLLEAVKMATWVPARILGLSTERGLLAPGFKADLTVFDENFNVKMTIVEGKIVYRSEL